ncbi:hypothetical protein ACTDI4_11815 [Mesorhizobium sp. PUT5]|uniref:hypothetical protein n=1 Tax=Mesorhizobium sp. PUT5 TaxID=3454629 RepID=UPI003FA43226
MKPNAAAPRMPIAIFFITHRPFSVVQAKPCFFRVNAAKRPRPTSEARRNLPLKGYLPFTVRIEGDYSKQVKKNDQTDSRTVSIRLPDGSAAWPSPIRAAGVAGAVARFAPPHYPILFPWGTRS